MRRARSWPARWLRWRCTTCEHALGDEHHHARALPVIKWVYGSRRRVQGHEHVDTLRCSRRLALLLGEAGELGNARRLLESALRAHERQDGHDAADTVATRAALAGILAAQG